MKEHIITDEEAERFYCIYAAHQGSFKDARKAALLDFLTNRRESTLGKLRPIEEMPEKVPEGCVRVYSHRRPNGNYGAGDFRMPKDTLAADIQLPTPDPEAEERQRFEEWARTRGYTNRELQFQTEPGATYKDEDAEAFWIAWKARAELAKAK